MADEAPTEGAPSEVSDEDTADPMPVLSDEAIRERIFVLLEAARPDGDFKVADLVEKVLAFLREMEPELLERFVETMMRDTLNSFYRKRLRDRRRRLRRSKKQDDLEATFRAAVEDVALADKWFEQAHAVDEKNTMRPVADMTGHDHEFVAARYQASGARDLLLAAFHRRVGKVVGKKRTAEVMSEAEYERMFRIVVKGA